MADLDYLEKKGLVEDISTEYDELDKVIARLNPRQRSEVLMIIQKMYHIK